MKLFDFKIRISLYSLLRPNFIFSTLSLCRSSKWCSNLTFNQIDPFSRSFLQIIPGLRQVYGGISGRACCPQFPVLTSAEMLIPHNFLFCLPPSLSPPQRYLSTHFCSIFLFSVLHIAYCTLRIWFSVWLKFRPMRWEDCHWCDGVIFDNIYEIGCMWHKWCNNKLRPPRHANQPQSRVHLSGKYGNDQWVDSDLLVIVKCWPIRGRT